MQRRTATWVMLAACAGPMAMAAQQAGHPDEPGATASARLEPTTGNTALGTVSFHEQGSSVRVTATVSGLKPNTEHGFHVHEKGDCSSGDGESAGGHFNPDGMPHGPQAGPHHAGDMPSLKANELGVAEAEFTLTGVTVAPGSHSLTNRGLIVHAKPDDFTTQPTGDAGSRIACGVIAVAESHAQRERALQPGTGVQGDVDDAIRQKCLIALDQAACLQSARRGERSVQ